MISDIDINDLVNNARFISKKDNTIIKKAIIMMGSNDNAEVFLTHAQNYLNTLGGCLYSDRIISKDYTGRSFDYTNQAVLIHFFDKINLQKLRNQLSLLEKQSGRAPKQSYLLSHIVPLDLDILFCADNNDNWQIIKERYPFKLHEISVLKNLGLAID